MRLEKRKGAQLDEALKQRLIIEQGDDWLRNELNQVLALVVLSLFWALGGFGLAPLVPSFFGAAGHVTGLTTSQTLARMSLLNSLAVIGAKVVMGGLAESVGLQIAFVLPIVLMFIAGILSGRLAKQAKRKEAVENAFPITGSLTVIDEL